LLNIVVIPIVYMVSDHVIQGAELGKCDETLNFFKLTNN